jgi:hypothetical protein
VIPAKGIVIVALSNRRDPYSMSTLVGDIEDVLLQNY